MFRQVTQTTILRSSRRFGKTTCLKTFCTNRREDPTGDKNPMDNQWIQQKMKTFYEKHQEKFHKNTEKWAPDNDLWQLGLGVTGLVIGIPLAVWTVFMINHAICNLCISSKNTNGTENPNIRISKLALSYGMTLMSGIVLFKK